ncbi:CHASE3 domain-containing protein [Methylobacterium sp. Leaf465]|uniref:CHASE3 domain-containing protein n=1 Tax=Methylobacterium sp. Leaf465 TaxID=1736385 RepID=UPI0009EA34A0|nr:CHASE3 domain-containing protein [Methylobacterium sp. Leaf465]
MNFDAHLPRATPIQPKAVPGRFRDIAPLIIGFLLLIATAAATANLVAEQDANRAELRRSVRIRDAIFTLYSGLQDAESGQRGFLLSGDETYLKLYEEAGARTPGRLSTIAEAVARNPGMSAIIARLSRAAEAKLGEMRETVALRRTGQVEAALARMRSGEGKHLMDEIRSLFGEAQADNYRRLISRQEQAGEAARQVQLAVAAAVVLIVLLGAYVVIDASRRHQRTLRAHAALQEANASLIEAAATRDMLENRLRQSQKMEALGQLTGGLAHDFNNMLAIVIGNLSLLKRRLERGERAVERYAEQALKAADRAATLTHRLLAFARKQPLAPEAIACNRLIAAMSDLLRRSLGESIRIETVAAPDLWTTKADANQLENAILNLAVNACDAMPKGGRLVIETDNVHLDETYAARNPGVPAGPYVLVALTDSGGGMPPDVAAKAFDPFFTTKPVGQGTGLGLSQVYGFVRQSGGHVAIYSEPGRGTTVRLYLPRHLGDAAEMARVTPTMLPEGSAREVILVVEDEDGVRDLAVAALRDLRYTVIHAEGAKDALQKLDTHPEIALLFTDVVMPEVNGRELAQAVHERRPDLPVLFTTGYTRNAIVHNGLVDADVQLLAKPYTLEQLALKVRQAMVREAA